MVRQNPISFTGDFEQNVPTNILAAVRDVEGVLFKSAPFKDNPPQGTDVNEAMKFDDKTLEEKAALCFPIGSVWERKEFERRLHDFSIASDFKFSWTCSSSTSFECCKYGAPRKPKGVQIPVKKQNSMKCGCKWRITTSNLWTYPPKKEGGERRKWLSSPPDEEEKHSMFIVVNSVPKEPHNHPGDKTTYQDTLKKGGHISRAFGEDSAMVRHSLLILRKNGFLSNQDIRTLGDVSTPSCIVWDNDRCSAWRKKMVRLSMTLSPIQYETQKAFEASFMSPKIQEMFKDDLGDAEYADIVSKTAKEELSKFYNERFQRLDPETQESEIDAWFKRMKEIDPFFDYELMLNDQKEIIGVVWMTGHMRRDLEELGDYLMLDMMKKETNTHLFLYASIVLHRSNKSLCVACEALLLNESLPTYKFLCDATFRMAFEIKKEDVHIIAGDEFLDQDKIRDVLGFPNAKFIFDQFHLIQVNLRKKFTGTPLFDMIQPQIYKWINAHTEKDFEDEFDNLNKQMKNLNCTAPHFNAIKDLKLKKDHFAWHKLRSYKGTLRRKGNPGSESNHASVAAYLKSNTPVEIPQMFCTLSYRQLDWNDRAKNKYQSEETMLRFTNDQIAIPILVNASQCIDGSTLNQHGYQLFVSQYNYSNRITFEEDNEGNMLFEDGIILEKNKPCKCEYRNADLIQCCHEIKRSGEFDVKCFAKRYIYYSRRWEQKLPRKGVDAEVVSTNETKGLSMEQETNSTHPGGSISNSVDGCDSDNLEHHEESSVLVTDFSYNQILDLSKNMVSAITHRDREFKKRACAAIHGITQLAKSDTVNITTGLNSLWESYLYTEQEYLNSSKTVDPQRKSKSFRNKQKRIPFRFEIANGSSGLNRGTKRSLNIADDTDNVKDAPKGKKSKNACGFCNNPTCTSKKIINCPTLLEYGGVVIARHTDIVKNRPNEAVLESLRSGRICHPSNARHVPKGMFDRNSHKHARHFILHSVHLRNDFSREFVNDPNNVEVLVTAIDFQGKINDSCKKCKATYLEFQNFVSNRTEKKRFIIDRREIDQKDAHERSQIVATVTNNRKIPLPSQGNRAFHAGIDQGNANVGSQMVATFANNGMMPYLSQGNQAFHAGIDQGNANVGSQMVATSANNGMMPYLSQGDQAFNARNMHALSTTMVIPQFPIAGLSQGVSLSQPNGLSHGVPLSQSNGLSQGVHLPQPNGQVSIHGHQPVTAQGYQFPFCPQGYASGNGSFNGGGSHSYDYNHQSQNDPEEKEFDM